MNSYEENTILELQNELIHVLQDAEFSVKKVTVSLDLNNINITMILGDDD